jgi:hypothetical protein
MVMQTVPGKATPSQAEQAELAYAGCFSAPRDTCQDVNSVYAGCNRPGFPSFDDFGFDTQVSDSPLTWDALSNALSKGPVLFGWCVDKHCTDDTRTSLGHWMVAVEKATCAAKDGTSVGIIKVFNPAPCCVGQVLNLPFATYAQGGAGLKFWRNYYDVRTKGTPAAPPPAINPIPPPADSFPPGTGKDAAATAAQTATTCLSDSATWTSSGLLRDGGQPPASSADVQPAHTIARRYLPLATLGALTTRPGHAMLDTLTSPIKLVAVSLRETNDKRALASVVLEELSTGEHRALGFEDSRAAERLSRRFAEAQSTSVDPVGGDFVDYVVLETGLHFIIAADKTGTSQDAIVILSEIDCRMQSDDEKAARMPLEELIERLTVSD